VLLIASGQIIYQIKLSIIIVKILKKIENGNSKWN
jgi:hypothetical protein